MSPKEFCVNAFEVKIVAFCRMKPERECDFVVGNYFKRNFEE
jgi:hypothetical protein